MLKRKNENCKCLPINYNDRERERERERETILTIIMGQGENYSSNTSASSTTLNSPDSSPDTLYDESDFFDQDQKKYKEGYENLLTAIEEYYQLSRKIDAEKQNLEKVINSKKLSNKRLVAKFASRSEKYSDYQVRTRQEMNTLRQQLRDLKISLNKMQQKCEQLLAEKQQLQEQSSTLEAQENHSTPSPPKNTSLVGKISVGLGGLGILSVSVYYLQSKGKLQSIFRLLKKINFLSKKKKQKG